MQGPEPTVELIMFDVIDEAMVLKTVYQSKGGSGPSGDRWQNIPTGYGDTGSDPRVIIATFTR